MKEYEAGNSLSRTGNHISKNKGGKEIVLDKGNPKPNPDLAKAVVKRCYEKGLILLTAGGFGNIIRHLVPLIVTDKQLEKGLDILDEALAEMIN